jgi:3D (Asp-Asp-Asp) domain-containing protein
MASGLSMFRVTAARGVVRRHWVGGLVIGLALFVNAASAVSAEELTSGDAATVAGTDGRGMRLRTGPGMSHRIITVLPEGTVVTIMSGPVADGEADWYQVSASSGTGWGIAQYLKAPAGAGGGPGPVAALGLGATSPLSPKLTPDGRRSFVAKMTAYADGVGGVPSGARTATGTKTRWGVVAVDPKVIPLGSTLRIDGYPETVFTAEDIGGAIRGNALDIWLPDREAAKRYGTQYRLVTVITEGKRR